MSALRDIQMQLDQTAHVIERFRSSVAEGSVIDLTGLDRRIEGMCDDINALPEGERATLKGTLIGLIDDLNALVELLTRQQEKASEALKGVVSREKAVSAYGKGLGTARAPKGDPAK